MECVSARKQSETLKVVALSSDAVDGRVTPQHIYKATGRLSSTHVYTGVGKTSSMLVIYGSLKDVGSLV